jgi:hypothetical protein
MGRDEKNYDESAVFWKAYIGGGAGVAIESKVGKLKEFFRAHVACEHSDLRTRFGPEAIAGEVSYIDYETDSTAPEYPLRLIYKHGGFAEEREYRVVLDRFGMERMAKMYRGETVDPLLENICM